jgi:hypothetical protein
MQNINFIIAQKEDLKLLIYQWLDEHPISNLHTINENMSLQKPKSRTEIAEYLGISKVTVTDWMKKGLPYRRMNGRVYFMKKEVMESMKSFNRRKNCFIE